MFNNVFNLVQRFPKNLHGRSDWNFCRCAVCTWLWFKPTIVEIFRLSVFLATLKTKKIKIDFCNTFSLINTFFIKQSTNFYFANSKNNSKSRNCKTVHKFCFRLIDLVERIGYSNCAWRRLKFADIL